MYCITVCILRCIIVQSDNEKNVKSFFGRTLYYISSIVYCITFPRLDMCSFCRKKRFLIENNIVV